MGVEPAGDTRHHRREDRSGRGPDHQPEEELETRPARSRDSPARDYAASTTEPVSTTGSGPSRSDKVPQIMLVKAIARKTDGHGAGHAGDRPIRYPA